MTIGGIYNKEYNAPGALPGIRFRVASRNAGASAPEGDTASFSQQSLSRLGARIAANDSMSASSISATLDDGNGIQTRLTFNNKTGAITWNGNALNLKGFANTLTDDVVVRNGDGVIEVYNLSTNQKLTLNDDGTRKTVDGKVDESAITDDSSAASSLSVGLFINNRGKAATAGGGNDIVVNRQADVMLNAGLGDDKIFNFAATAATLAGGGGNDAVYTVGLTRGTEIDVSSGDSYVKLLGNMTGGSISLGGGQNYVDASGRTLSGVTVSDSGAEASVLTANSLTNGSTVDLSAAQAAVDAKLISSSAVDFGSGANSLVADKVIGTAAYKSVISSTGTNTYQVGTVAQAEFDSAGAVSDAIKITGAVSDTAFDLSKGENLLDATGKTLTAVKITSAEGGEGGTTILAGSIVGRNGQKASDITLAGSESGNRIEVAKAVTNTDIDTGDGAATVKAGSLNAVKLTMGGATSSGQQSLTVAGKVAALDYTGSAGDDNILIQGAVSKSDFDLGKGNNSFTAKNTKGVNQTVSSTNITTSGSGSTQLIMGNYVFGQEGNEIVLGNGKNTITMGSITGKDTVGLTINLSAAGTQDQTVNINGAANRLNYMGAGGADLLTVTGGIANSEIDLGAGNNSLTAKNAKNVYQKVSNTYITASGEGGTSLEIGNYVFGQGGNEISLGNGKNTITMGSITGKDTVGLKINLSAAKTQDQTVIINGAANRLNYIGADSADLLIVAGGIANSEIDLGAGNNSLAAKNAKKVYQKVSNTNIRASGEGGTKLEIGNYVFGQDGNEISLGNGENTIGMGSITGKGTLGLEINLSAAETQAQTVNINGAVNLLDYQGAGGADLLTVAGGIANSKIDLGAGNNSLTAKNAKKAYQKVSNTNITASGEGGTKLEIGNYVFGQDGNEISLGNGENSISMGSITGKGTLGLEINLSAAETQAQTVNINGAANRLTYTGAGGADLLTLADVIANSEIDLGAGNNSLTAINAKKVYQKVSNTSIKASGEGGTKLEIGNYVFGQDGNEIALGNGKNTINMGSITGKGTVGLEINLSAAEKQAQTVIINGSAANLTYSGSAADDAVTVNGNLTASTLDLGNGSNVFAAENAKSKVTDSHISAESASSNIIAINTFTTSKKGSSSLILGDGDDLVTLNSVSGSTSLDMGGGAENTFIAQTLTGISLSGGGGKYTVTNGKDATLDFSGSTDKVRLNIQTALANSLITLGAANAHIGSAYEENSSSSATLSGSTIKGGTGRLTVDARNITNSNILMPNAMTEEGEEGEETVIGGGADISVNESLSGSTLNLGAGESTLTAKNISKSTVTRAEAGSLLLQAGTVSGSTFNLTGDGSDTLNVSGSLSATLNLDGQGADEINAGVLGGNITSNEAITLNAARLSQLTATLNGDTTIGANSIESSKLTLGSGNNLIAALPKPENTTGEEGEENPSGQNQDGEEAAPKYGLSISGSTIQSGSDLTLRADDITSSTLTLKAAENGQALLDLELAGTLQGSTVNLSGGASSILASALKGSTITRSADGTLNLEAASVSGGSFNLGGVGEDSITVSGDLSAFLTLGQGRDVIDVGGDISGRLTAADDVKVIAGSMSNLEATLSGAENRLDITESITGGKLNLGNGNTIVGNDATTYSGVQITAGNGDNTLLGSAYTGGSISMGDGKTTVGNDATTYSGVQITAGNGDNTIQGSHYADGSISMGNGNNDLAITEALSAKVTLGEGENAIGTADTSLRGFSFSGTGSNTIRGKDLVGGSVSMGGAGKTNSLLLGGTLENSAITLNGGANSLGSLDLTIVNSTITSGDEGENSIQAASLNGATVNLGASNDTLEVYGNIVDSSIGLGGGSNTLRNTLTTAEAGQGISGQGSAVTNTVQNSSITVMGDTKVYLGQVKDGSSLTASGSNTLVLAGVADSAIDASAARGGSVSIGTLNGTITAGQAGSIRVNRMESGLIQDDMGQNSITVGVLGERAVIQTGDVIHSTTIHVNQLDGTINLGNENYGGSKQGNLTRADTAYDGTVNIAGTKASGAGVAAGAVDTSTYGLGEA